MANKAGMSLMRALVMAAKLLVVRALVVVTALKNVSQPNSSSYMTIICFIFFHCFYFHFIVECVRLFNKFISGCIFYFILRIEQFLNYLKN